MKSFKYTVKDENGIHARPAGTLVSAAREFSSSVSVKKDDKEADGKRLFSLMSLGVRHGEEISYIINGSDEERACEVLLRVCRETLG